MEKPYSKPSHVSTSSGGLGHPQNQKSLKEKLGRGEEKEIINKRPQKTHARNLSNNLWKKKKIKVTKNGEKCAQPPPPKTRKKFSC